MYTLRKELHMLFQSSSINNILSHLCHWPGLQQKSLQKCTVFWMIVSFDKNASIWHFLSIKEFLYCSSNHMCIFVWFAWVFHGEIVAFMTLGAIKTMKIWTWRNCIDKIFGPNFVLFWDWYLPFSSCISYEEREKSSGPFCIILSKWLFQKNAFFGAFYEL